MFARQMGIDVKILKWEVKGSTLAWDGVCKAEKKKEQDYR